MMPDLTTDSGWHLDKRVPIAIVLAIFFQTAGIVWFAATLENRVAQLEASQAHRADERDRLICAGNPDAGHPRDAVAHGAPSGTGR
jgi:hypothetical protein